MKNVTPKSMRCFFRICPAIYEVTPQDMRCVIKHCPAIYEVEGGHVIIGKIMGSPPSAEEREAMLARVPEEIRSKVGPDEMAVWTPAGLVKPGDGI